MKRILLGVVLAVLVVSGVSLYVLMAPGGSPGGGVVNAGAQPATTGLGAPGGPEYGCSTPAIQSQYSCDTLPAGYQIPPKLPVSPAPYCDPGMTASACALLKQTWGNGVCDPNETVWTSPIDCGCSGALTGDPFTGRCNSPATVCQVAVRAQNPPQG